MLRYIHNAFWFRLNIALSANEKIIIVVHDEIEE